jgi:hypothetical protein
MINLNTKNSRARVCVYACVPFVRARVWGCRANQAHKDETHYTHQTCFKTAAQIAQNTEHSINHSNGLAYFNLGGERSDTTLFSPSGLLVVGKHWGKNNQQL